MLSFDDDTLFKDLKKQIINIDTLLSKAIIKLQCNKCKKSKKTKILFKSLPKILIIYIKPKIENNITFNYNIDIELKKYLLENKDNASFELISMIRIGPTNEIKTYCKSSKNNMWYKYTESLNQEYFEEIILLNELGNYKDIPNLLIYQKK